MMFAAVPSLKSRKKSDLLVIPFWKGKKQAEAAADVASLKQHIVTPLATHDFLAKEGEILILYVAGEPEKRIALLGLGPQDELTVEKLRRAYSSVTKTCHQKKIEDINLILPEGSSLSKDDLIRGVAEGLLLSNYTFTTLKHDALKDNEPVLLKKAHLIGASKHELALAEKYATISHAVDLARDLVNGNADDITPQYLAAVAQGLAKTCSHVKTTVFDKKRIEKEKMGLLLAVNRSSPHEPAVIIAEYKGNPKSADHTVIVGKGITFDTGGLNLKPTGSMETMKCDMAGAAAALAIIQAASSLGLKVNVTAVIGSTENCIGSKSYKPGDVYKSAAGTTVEIGNTDAEGRLVLADVLAYTVKHLKPTRIIDLATLTGAVEVALGTEATGLLSNNDVLADLLIRFGSETFERVWRLPLYEEYKDQLKSDVADIKSTGGRQGGCITAAMFLQQFVGKTPWAHLDIAGTAFLPEGKRYLPKQATGVGVRLIISLLENL